MKFTTRSPKRIPAEKVYIGLIGWLGTRRVPLPLKGVECEFDICGSVVEVVLDQVYFHEGDTAMECVYTFPLPAGATVYLCEMHVNDRVIKAVAREENEARRIAEEQTAAGQRTALVEMERDNLFTLTLGNVQPDDLIVIRFGYFQSVDGLGAERSLRIPFTPGVRYIPGRSLIRSNKGDGSADDTDQVPDASRLTPPRIDELHSDAAYLKLSGSLNATISGGVEIESPTHSLAKSKPVVDGIFEIQLDDSRPCPDRDFQLRWIAINPEAATQNHAWTCGEYAMVELVAPESVGADVDFEQDVYFLLDRSGSMRGEKWRKAAEAFLGFLGTLNPDDRAFGTLFSWDYEDIAEAPYLAANLLDDPNVLGLPQRAPQGGTEMLKALRHVLEKVAEHSAERHATLVILTDGQIGNEAEVLKELRKNEALRVHTFGIDDAVNDGLLKEIARQQRGVCRLQTPDEDFDQTIVELGRQITRPVLLGLDVGGDDWELPRGTVPDLFAGQVLSIPIRHRAGGSNEKIRIDARLANGNPQIIEVQPEAISSEGVRLMWQRDRVEHLIENGKRKEAIKLAVASNIVCDGVSFVAWDTAERVDVAATKVYQPSLEQERGILFDAMYAEAPAAAAGPVRLQKRRVKGKGRIALERACVMDPQEVIRERASTYLSDTGTKGLTECVAILVKSFTSAKKPGVGVRIKLLSKGRAQVIISGVELASEEICELLVDDRQWGGVDAQALAVCAVAAKLKVTGHSDGQSLVATFRRGKVAKHFRKAAGLKFDSVEFDFFPDKKIFAGADYDRPALQALLDQLQQENPTLKIVLE